MRATSSDCIYELAKKDKRVVFIGSDLGAGAMEKFRQEMPERCFIEGVSEQHIIGMAAGLALEGFIPYVSTISTFLTRRCYEQIIVDICLHNLPVRLVAIGGGLVYAPLGPTHLATEDIAVLRTIPNMTIIVPGDNEEVKTLYPQTLEWTGPIYLRLGGRNPSPLPTHIREFSIGRAVLFKSPGDVLIVTTGMTTEIGLKAAAALESKGIKSGVLHLHTIKPIDKEAIRQFSQDVRLVITVEEHNLIGGLGCAVLEVLSEYNSLIPKIARIGLPDEFLDGYGSQEFLMTKYHISSEHIVEKISEAVGHVT